MIALNFSMVRDDTVTFTCRPLKPNGLVDIIPLEMLFSEYGMIIPQYHGSLNLLDYFETTVFAAENHSVGIIALLVTPSGKLYQYYAQRDTGVRRARVPVGKGAFSVRSESRVVEELVVAAHLLYTDTQKAVAALEAFHVTMPNRFITLTVTDIMNMLKERGITKEPPAIHYLGEEDVRMGRDARQIGG